MRFAGTRSVLSRGSEGRRLSFGGIHATLYANETQSLGGAQAVVKSDGDVAWPLELTAAVGAQPRQAR